MEPVLQADGASLILWFYQPPLQAELLHRSGCEMPARVWTETKPQIWFYSNTTWDKTRRYWMSSTTNSLDKDEAIILFVKHMGTSAKWTWQFFPLRTRPEFGGVRCCQISALRTTSEFGGVPRTTPEFYFLTSTKPPIATENKEATSSASKRSPWNFQKIIFEQWEKNIKKLEIRTKSVLTQS